MYKKYFKKLLDFVLDKLNDYGVIWVFSSYLICILVLTYLATISTNELTEIRAYYF